MGRIYHSIYYNLFIFAEECYFYYTYTMQAAILVKDKALHLWHDGKTFCATELDAQ